MNKILLCISLALIAPVCQAMNPGAFKQPGRAKTAKNVDFEQNKEVRAFKKGSETDKFIDQKIVPLVAPKPSMQIRIGNSLLGLAMIWAGIYAIPTAIKNPGDNAFFRAISIGAFVSGVAITLVGFEKIKSAIWG